MIKEGINVEISLVNLILIGVPETILYVMTGLVMYRSSVKQNIPLFIVKLIIHNIILLSVVYIDRQIFSNVMYITLINTFVNMLIFNFLWEMNWRQSLLAAVTSMFILMFIETTTLPLYEKVRSLYGNENFFSVILKFSILYRIIHILIFLILTKYNLRGSRFLEKKWNLLPVTQRIFVTIFIISVGLCYFANANYYDLFMRYSTSTVDLSAFALNIKFIYWSNIAIFIVFVLLLVLVYILENQFQQAKAFLDIPPEELMDIIGDDSDEQEINGYIAILQQKLEVKEDVTQ